MKHTNQLPDIDLLRYLFSYNEEKGILTRNISRGNKLRGSVVGVKSNRGHLNVEIDGKNYGVHRIIWKMHYLIEPSADIDHRDHNEQNNKINNLRLATVSNNLANSRIYKCNKTGFKGVGFIQGKYIARIRYQGKLIWLGRKSTAIEAYELYKDAALKYFGEFANVS